MGFQVMWMLQVPRKGWAPPSRQWLHSQGCMWLPSDGCTPKLRGQCGRSGRKSAEPGAWRPGFYCSCALASCVTLGKSQHCPVPLAASQAQGHDEVGDCCSGYFYNSKSVSFSCPQSSLRSWEARYPRSTSSSVQVHTAVHHRSKLEWYACLGVSFYSHPLCGARRVKLAPRSWRSTSAIWGRVYLARAFEKVFSTEIRTQNPRASLLHVNPVSNHLLCNLG